METNLKTTIKRETCNAIIIAAILFTNLVIESARYIKYVYATLAITLIYVIFLIIKKPQIIKGVFSSYSFLWIIIFAVEMFFYGFFGEDKSAYSLKFHFLNLMWIVTLLIILQSDSKRTIEMMAKASSIVLVMMSIYIILTTSMGLGGLFSDNEVIRLGSTAVGNENTTAISYIFLLIPIFYKISIDKVKRYIPIAFLGVFFMFLTGSKKSILSLILIIIIIGMGKSTNKKKLLNNILKIILIITILLIFCYSVPILHSLIWERIEAMFMSLNNINTSDQSSTGIRINFIITALKKTWDKPILGHGWASFAPMYGYSSLYKTNLYTHNNYAEVLFSFGLLGFFLYYWFPIRNIIKNIRNKDVHTKTFCWLYIIIILFIDVGTVSCYSSILGFLGFSIVNMVLNSQNNCIDKKE